MPKVTRRNDQGEMEEVRENAVDHDKETRDLGARGEDPRWLGDARQERARGRAGDALR